jgi:CheY-like chemotaxis protein
MIGRSVATILIVDDDKHTRELLERIIHNEPRLQARGVKVVHAEDGETGLRVFESERPTLVVTDLLMPRMDGFRFCEAVRKHPAGQDIGLLVVSGVYRDHAVGQRLRDQFHANLFTKPYQLKELVEALCTELGAGHEEPSVAALVESAGASDEPPPPPRDGELAERPLPALLLDLHEEKATGLLEIRRGKVEKRIDWVVGYPVSVSSNQRSEALGHFLVGRGVISEAQHQTALERAHDEEVKLGEALTELGLVSAAELTKQLGAQARQKITAALRWQDGTWSFRPDRSLLDGANGTAMDPVAIVLLGLKRTVPIDEASQKVTGFLGKRVRLSPRGERVQNGIIRAFGALLVDELRQGALVDRLLADPFEPAKAIPAIEALHAAGCLLWATDASTEEVIEIEPLDPYALDELSVALEIEAEPPPLETALPAPFEAAGDALLYQAIFGTDPITGVEDVSSGVPETVETLDSSVVDVARFGPEDPVTSPIPRRPELLRKTGPAPVLDPAVAAAREAILAEHLRIRGRDWYQLFGLARDADALTITKAAAALEDRFRLEKWRGLDLGADYAKLEEIVGVHRLAKETLTQPQARATYDQRLGGGTGSQTHDAMRAELAFREGEKRLAAGQIAPAVECLQRAVSAAPHVADYHAGLGWALYLVLPKPGETAVSRERSHRHLGQALAIDADHGAAHEYSGRILFELGEKEESALAHLERALDARPPRLGALPALEELRRRRREVPLLERRCRKLIHGLQSSATPGDALRLWLTLGSLYRGELRDRDAARTAYQSALKLSPEEPAALAALGDLYAGDAARFAERTELLRTRWRLDPSDPAPGRDLFAGAVAAGQPDLAFVSAALLVARKAADDAATAYHRRFRAGFLPRAHLPGSLPEILDPIRHPDDDPEVGELIARIAPAAAALEPLTLADLEVGPLEPVDEAALSPVFKRVRDYLAGLLGVAPPRVVVCSDFAEQIHVAGMTPPVLLAGPTALAATDPVELGFRLGRAASYLLPGRAFGGSRPGRVLRDVVMGVMEAAVGGGGEDPTGRVGRIRDAARALPEPERQPLFGLARQLAEDRRAVNMSRWARGIARTADRLGLVLCGDPAVAGSVLGDFVEGEVFEALCEFALSPAHLAARRALGLSVDV